MMVLGADMHKGSHTVAAVAATTGELLGDKTVEVGQRGFTVVLDWARGLGAERVWALEDCRHVCGSFARFLLVRGERVVRVATRLMAGERRGGRDRGKSDPIDALAVARAALRAGLDRLPVHGVARNQYVRGGPGRHQQSTDRKEHRAARKVRGRLCGPVEQRPPFAAP
jgi:transposase